MTAREELLESLVVERSKPIPPRRVLPAALPPDRSGGADTPEAQEKRRADLLAEADRNYSPWADEDAAERAATRTPKEPAP